MPSKTSHVLPTRYCLATTNGEHGERLRRMRFLTRINDR